MLDFSKRRSRRTLVMSRLSFCLSYLNILSKVILRQWMDEVELIYC